MGQYAVRATLEFDFVESVVVADLDLDAAERFAANCGPKAHAAHVEVTDPGRLAELMGDADVVLNTVGPFFRFGVPVLRAAIEARCDYIDICDDWEPTLEMFELDASAREAGVVAVIGVGASPGVSNMLAVEAARELDEVHALFTGWDLDSASPEHHGSEPSAATVHGIQQLTGTIRTLRDRRFVDRAPIQRFDIDYPGLGRYPVWSIGHPEAVTLPRVYPSLSSCVNVMSTGRLTIFALRRLAWLIDHGWVSPARVASWVEAGGRTGTSDTQELGEMLATGDWNKPPPLFALAEGSKDGAPARVGAAFTSAPLGGMGGATGVPLAVGVALLHEPGERRPGVHAPEGVFDPDRFFELLAPRCMPARTSPSELALVTRSWESVSLVEKLRTLGGGT